MFGAYRATELGFLVIKMSRHKSPPKAERKGGLCHNSKSQGHVYELFNRVEMGCNQRLRKATWAVFLPRGLTPELNVDYYLSPNLRL
jgi:hypothetical protein